MNQGGSTAADSLESLLEKLQCIRTEALVQICHLREDAARVDMTRLVDLTAELKDVMLNPGLRAPKNYPLVIADFISNNPLTISALEELVALTGEFDLFLKS